VIGQPELLTETVQRRAPDSTVRESLPPLVIAGAGTAGTSLALKLAELGIESTLIDNSFDDCVEFDRRTTTPIARQDVIGYLGLDVPEDDVSITGKKYLFGDKIIRLLSRIEARMDGLGQRPFVVIDGEASLARLHKRARASEHIRLVEGRVMGVTLSHGGPRTVIGLSVTRVEAGNEGSIKKVKMDLATSLVIDATGRGTSGVADLLAKEQTDLVEEVTTPQATTYLGAYVEVDNTKLSNRFIGASHTFFIGLLPGGIHVYFAPHETKGSPANHVLFVSGNSERIRTVYAAAKGNRLQALTQLLAGTLWEEILECTTTADRTTYFQYTKARARYVKVGGLALIGDAGVHTSPTLGAGYGYIARDIQTLLGIIRTVQASKSGEIDSGMIAEAGEYYNQIQARVYRRRMARARRTMKAINYLDKIFGSQKPERKLEYAHVKGFCIAFVILLFCPQAALNWSHDQWNSISSSAQMPIST